MTTKKPRCLICGAYERSRNHAPDGNFNGGHEFIAFGHWSGAYITNRVRDKLTSPDPRIREVGRRDLIDLSRNLSGRPYK